MHVVVIGNGIIGNLAALYLRRRLDADVSITLIGPTSREGMPVVGESTIEIAAQFLENRLGLGPYLAETHYPKYGLTYYFKLHPEDPSNRTYSVQCNEREPHGLAKMPGWSGPMARPPSWQLNREVFDRDIQGFVDREQGIDRIAGNVTGLQISAGGPHQVSVSLEDGGSEQVLADWLVDASGRRQLIARKLGLRNRPKEKQRDCFWFRLSGFDRSILSRIDALGPMPAAKGEPYHHDRYYTTHHFMGKGNWIWCIPLRTADDSELISVGLSSRPDVYPHRVTSVDAFMECVAKEHPVITELVASGTIDDTNVYKNYRYTITQAYSENRWCIIGDAAFAPDPLFSNGISFSTLQIEQIGEMMARDHAGEHDPEFIKRLERVFWKPVTGSQNTIANWYETMDDALLCAPRLHFIEVTYFYFVLPLIVNRCHYEADRLDMWHFFTASENGIDVPQKLRSLRQKIARAEPRHFVYHGKDKVNLRALTWCDDLRELGSQQSEGVSLLERYVEELSGRWGSTKRVAAARRKAPRKRARRASSTPTLDG